MSAAEDLQTIYATADADAVKARRTVRRSSITRLHKKYEQYPKSKTEELLAINATELEGVHKSLKESIDSHNVIQERYDELKGDGSDRASEIARDEDIIESYDKLLCEVTNTLNIIQLHRKGRGLQRTIKNLLRKEHLSAPTTVKEIQSIKDAVQQFDLACMDYEREELIAEMVDSVQEMLTSVDKRVADDHHSHLPTEHTASSESSSPPASSVAKLNLELPKFSGMPTDWPDFHALFTAAIDKRAFGLSDPERCCLLANAMVTEESRKLVLYYQSGPNGYASALRALVDAYGQPQLIYPHHVKAILTPDTYSYTRRGLRHMRETLEIHMRGIERVKGNTYKQFLGAIALDRFDSQMRHEWTAHYTDSSRLPDIDEILKFFRKREFALPDDPSEAPAKSKGSKARDQHARTVMRVGASSANTCPACSADHSLNRCSVFLGYDAAKRQQIVKEAKRCTNCLSSTHMCGQCPSVYNCRKCKRRHHTLLHRESSSPASPSSATTTETSAVTALVASSSMSRHNESSSTSGLRPGLLNTAIVDVYNGPRSRRVRIALDPGAAVSLMTESLASSLRLARHPQWMELDGLMGDGRSKHYVEATLHSTFSNEYVTCQFGVVSKIPCATPPTHPQQILDNPCIRDKSPLADRALGGHLDILIGALDVIQCIKGPTVYSKASAISATPTVFGWTIVAPLDKEQSQPILKVQVKTDPLHQSLQQLWELDKLPNEPTLTSEDVQALEHFNDTHSIQQDGRYVVKLPRIQNPPQLGPSRPTALRRFHQNERSLETKGKLGEFQEVLQEYITLDHAEQVPLADLKSPLAYYMPIQGVCKESSTTTKLRAVFDASARTSTGSSLNDCLLAGPNLYPKLTDILIRFRGHRVAFSADISKMFREIVLHQEERDYHRFLHKDETGRVQDLRMKRLTFGVRSSPFIATRVIQHLAETHIQTHPQAASTILHEFYVDDCLSGAPTEAEADQMRQQLCHLLSLAGMKLRKWRSNSVVFRNTIPSDLLETADLQLPSPLSSSKTLGMHWDVAHDTFHVAVPEVDNSVVTKRIVASISAKVYDVLGLFSPAIIPSKIVLQDIWKLQLDWDTPVPEDIAQRWSLWISGLPQVAQHPIPRRLISHEQPIQSKTLHGFSDASQVAYGAAVYLRTVHTDTSVSVTLIYSKARVAPLSTTTIPRLELVAAHLLTKLLVYVAGLLNIDMAQVYAWTDSSIVLCWLRKSSSSLKTFVAHRVSAIQKHLPTSQWRHVSSRDNPADLLSRGTTPQLLIDSQLWWHGPPWLKDPPAEWPTPQFHTPNSIPEIKAAINIVSTDKTCNPLWKLYSCFHHLTRVVAWIQRYLHNSKSPRSSRATSLVLTPDEISSSKTLLLRLSQREVYADVFDSISSGRSLPKHHPLHKFDVSVDASKLLIVSGRVRQKQNSKQPRFLIPLSLKSPLTQLLISSLHSTYSHSGVPTLLCLLAGTYYIPGLKNFLKLVSRRCVVCQKALARPLAQKMGLLPASRTTPSPPFYVTGIDFAGPLQIKLGHTRRPVIRKAYVCVFICFATKAVHFELCSDLSTSEFMAALSRFCARRGTPKHIHSDNGTNFQGSRNEIKELQKLMTSSDTQEALSHFDPVSDVQWHFIPPRAPHVGGLWEAGVKAMKVLLKKIVGPHILTFQELNTVLTEAEATLNSRPLTPLSSTDLDDDLALTAGHFLIGRPLKAPPTADSDPSHKISTLRRWNLVKRLQQDLWVTWSTRYLQSLHSRSRWSRATYNFQIGDVVLLKDEILRHRSWPLARVTRTFPGDDNLVRTVEVRCQGKIYKRSTDRLVLIVEEDQLSSPRRTSEPLSDQD